MKPRAHVFPRRSRSRVILIDRLYNWLAEGPAPDCDRIFAAALPHAGEGWSERITEILFQRGGEAAWAALIARYSDLSDAEREQLLANSESFRPGVAIAFKSTDPEVRRNALLALQDQPSPSLAYVAATAVRDPNSQIRGLGSQVLRKLADEFLSKKPSATEEGRTREAQRRQIVLAVEESLRTFDLHHRLEVVETALWFAQDLGEQLWERLTSRRSRVGVVVSEQMFGWDHPRLAYFLVSALKHSTWRHTAGKLLASWSTAEHLRALIEQSVLLESQDVRRGLLAVNNPKWFRGGPKVLDALPPDMRRHAPRWVCHAGYDDMRKTEILAHCVRSVDPDLHKASVYALAEIDTPGVRALLKQVAESDSPLAHFARWCAVALDTEIVRAALEDPSARKHHAPVTNVSPFRIDAVSADCTRLWQVCRRTEPSQRGPLMETLREHAELWRPQLRAYLKSPDPRDRVLVLQIVSTEQLALRFRHDLEPLLSDPIDGIRELAQTLVRALSRHPLAPPPADPPPPNEPEDDDDELTQPRRALRYALEQLSTGAADASNDELIEQVRSLLRDVYGRKGEADADQEAVEEQAC